MGVSYYIVIVRCKVNILKQRLEINMDNNQDFTEYIMPLLELVSNRFKVLHLRAKSAMEIPDRNLYAELLFEKARLLIGLPSLLAKQVDGIGKGHWGNVLNNIEFYAKKATIAIKSGGTSIMAGLLLDPGETNIENNWLERMVNELRNPN